MSVASLPRIDAPVVLRHRPRARLTGAAADLINRLARPREPLRADVEGLPLTLAPGAVLLDPAPPILDAAAIGFAVGDAALTLHLPKAILDRLARAVQPDLGSLPPGPAGPLLAELALAPLLDIAERITGTRLAIASVGPAAAPPSGTLTLLLEGRLAEEAFPAQLDLGPPPLLAPLPPRLAALLALAEAAPARSASVAALPVAVAFVAGQTRLTHRQLRHLETGDAVLPDVWHPARGETQVMLGEALLAVARTDRHRSTLKTPFRPVAAGAGSGDESMGQDKAAASAAEDAANAAAAGLDGMSLTLTFELGRRSLGLGELKGVGEGHVFDLGLDPDAPVDLIANGARIGQGEIVEIGERVGVRVVCLFGRD